MKPFEGGGVRYVPVKNSHDWHVLRLSRYLCSVGKGMQKALFATDTVTGHQLQDDQRTVAARSFADTILVRQVHAAKASLDALTEAHEGRLPQNLRLATQHLRRALQALSA